MSRYVKYSNKSNGFTFVELLIALMLGVLISAVALQVLYTSIGNDKQQAAHAQLQDTLVFTLPFLQRQLQKANYGVVDLNIDSHDNSSSNHFLNHNTPQGGIVLTAPSNQNSLFASGVTTNLPNVLLNGRPLAEKLLSRSEVSDSNIVGTLSDQITIQYKMPVSGQFDCQGRAIPKNYFVIERYFVRKDNKIKSLACASTNYILNEDSNQPIDIGRYTKPNGSKVNSYFSGKGSVIIPNVDYFRVLYGVSNAPSLANDNAAASIKYMPASNRPYVSFEGVNISSLKVGLIISSVQTTQTKSVTSFKLLDKQNLQLTQAIQNNKQVRKAVSMDVFLRNAQRAVW